MQLTINDIVRIFEVQERTVQRWIDKRHMPCVKANEQYNFNYIELLDWALKNKIRLPPEVLTLGERANSDTGILYRALKDGNINYDVAGGNREEVLRAIVDILSLPKELNRDFLYEMLISREKMMTTATGNGIAIPHVRNPVVLHIDQPSISLCFLKNPVDFKALDGNPVFIVFTILSPSIRKHLGILSRLAFCLQNTKLQEFLHKKASAEQILAEIQVIESGIATAGEAKKA